MRKFISGIFWAWLLVLPLCCIVTLANANVYEGEVKNIYDAVKTSRVILRVSKMYGYLFKNRKELYVYCKTIKMEDEDNHVLAAILTYLPETDSPYKGMTFILEVQDCENVPEKSVCIDENNCFIKYSDEDK